MKKLVLPLMASVSMALLLSACGSNMEDKEEKFYQYYQKHTDEAKEKYQWCLEKIKPNLTPEQLAVLEKVFKEGGFNQLGYSKIDDAIDKTYQQGELDRVNWINCGQVFYVFLMNYKETFGNKKLN